MRKRIRAEIGLPDDFEKRGPDARIKCLDMSGASTDQLMSLTNTGANLKILRKVENSLSSAIAGIACYLSFCALVGITPFPKKNRGPFNGARCPNPAPLVAYTSNAWPNLAN